MTEWERDEIQFPRLLAEIYMAGVTPEQYAALSESMDLPRERIDELFGRAESLFEADKAATFDAVFSGGTCILTPENMRTQEDCTLHDHEAEPGPVPDPLRDTLAMLERLARRVLDDGDNTPYDDAEAALAVVERLRSNRE